MNLFTLVATLGLDTSEFSKNIGAAVEQGKKAGSGLMKGVAVVGKAAAAIAVTASAAYVGLVKTAADKVAELEQNVGAAVAVWGDSLGEQQRRIAMQAAENVGLSTSQYLEMSNRMGSLMQGMGFDTRDAFVLSTQAIQRTADVASIMNIPIENAMEAINGLAKGNFEMMDNLGVAMNETALANYALEQGIKKSTSKMTTQEKVALALQMYMDKTAYATGNFAKEAEGLAGATTILKASWANLLDGSGTPEDFAAQLLNYVDTYMGVLKEVAPRILSSIGVVFSKIGERTRTWLDSVGGIGGAARLALDWTLGQFNLPDSNTIVEQVTAWWNGQGDNTYERIKNALSWAIGDVVLPSVGDFLMQVSVWWYGTAQPAIRNVLEWTLGELVLPAVSDMLEPVTTWWEGVQEEFADVFKFQWSADSFGFPSWSDIESNAKAFWEEAKEALSSLFKINIGVGFKIGSSTANNLITGAENTGSQQESGFFDQFRGAAFGSGRSIVTHVTQNIQTVPQTVSELMSESARSVNMLRFGWE